MATALSGKELAEELQAASHSRALHTPMEQVIEAAASNALTEDHCFRLIGQLLALERKYHFRHCGLGSNLNIHQYPSSVGFLLGKQVYDQSTHEMLYSQAILHKGWVKFQRSALRHPYCQFVSAS